MAKAGAHFWAHFWYPFLGPKNAKINNRTAKKQAPRSQNGAKLAGTSGRHAVALGIEFKAPDSPAAGALKLKQ